tara:strand:+ start:207 stop:1373 length:1167 start_codon:yes stop_codon:yes gene_type:complete
MTTLTCKVPWISITLSGNGNIKPCCVYQGGEYSYHNGDTLDSVWQDLDSLRKQFLAGEKPERCNQCWKREASLGTSRRMWYDDKITSWPSMYKLNPDMQLRHMDLNFGNKCNLKCRMCGSWGSTTWFNEEVALHKINPDFKRNPNKPRPTIIPASYWENKQDTFKYLERIDFKGGEPMMQEGMYDFLEYLIEWGLADNITIAYTTNGTKTPERLLELWPKFKKIKIVISIEGTGDLYQYIRGGKTQTEEQLIENIHWFDQFENLQGSFNTAIQIYNIFALPNILTWMRDTVNASTKWHADPDSFKFDCMVTNPRYLDINIMPYELKQLARSRIQDSGYKSLQQISNSLKNNSYDEKQWQLFCNFTKELDRMRGVDVLNVVPELKGYYK